MGFHELPRMLQFRSRKERYRAAIDTQGNTFVASIDKQEEKLENSVVVKDNKHSNTKVESTFMKVQDKVTTFDTQEFLRELKPDSTGCYKCELCTIRKYKLPGNLLLHLSGEHGYTFTNSLTCKECKKNYKSTKSLNQHVKKFHK